MTLDITRKIVRRFTTRFQEVRGVTSRLTPGEQDKLDAKAQQLLNAGYPQGIVSFGRKQTVNFAMGLARKFGGGSADEENTIVKNVIDQSVMPGGIYDRYVRDFYQAVEGKLPPGVQ